MRYVLINKFCADTGYSEKAVRRKIEEGVWLENQQYRRGPDGQLLIDRMAANEPASSDPAPPVPMPDGGVYLLWFDDKLAYVGRAIDLRTRIATHRRDLRQFDRYDLIPCSIETSIWLEKELIRTLRPAQNLVRYARHSAAAARIISAGADT